MPEITSPAKKSQQGEASGKTKQVNEDLFEYYKDYPSGLKAYVNSGKDVKVAITAVGLENNTREVTGKITSINFNTMKIAGDDGKQYSLTISFDANLLFPAGEMALKIKNAEITELPKDIIKGFASDKTK